MTSKLFSLFALFVTLAATSTLFHYAEAATLQSSAVLGSDSRDEERFIPHEDALVVASDPETRLLTDPSALCPYAIENKFEVLMSPDNNFHQTRFNVFRLNPDLSHNRKVLGKTRYASSAPDQSSSRCLYKIFCYKLIVYDTGADGMCCEHGNGSYKAYWNGKLPKRVWMTEWLIFVFFHNLVSYNAFKLSMTLFLR